MNRGDAKGRRWVVVLLACLPFLCKFGVMAVGVVGYAAQSLYKVLQLLIPIVWRRRVDGQGWRNSFWPWEAGRPTAATWAVAILSAAALAGSAILAVTQLAPWWGIEIDPDALRVQLDDKFALTPLRAAAIVLWLFTLNAALEELHFRAWLDRELSAAWGDRAGISLSATAFAAMHLFIFADLESATPTMLGAIFLALVLAGTVWSLIARRPGGIHAAWLSHGLTDAGLLTWGLFWLGYF